MDVNVCVSVFTYLFLALFLFSVLLFVLFYSNLLLFCILFLLYLHVCSFLNDRKLAVWIWLRRVVERIWDDLGEGKS